MGDALGVLGLMGLLGVLFVAVWVISGAASRYDQRRKARGPVEGNVGDDLKDAVVTLCSGIGALVAGLVGCLGRLVGCVVFFVLGLVGLFFVVWLFKRMWEVA